MSLRKNHEVRLKAFDRMQELKQSTIPQLQIIKEIQAEFKISKITLYDWYAGRSVPWGRKESLTYVPELFYVLGALMGDGCLYQWKASQHHTILVGDKAFAEKYSSMLSRCVGREIKAYIDRSKNIWFVRYNNFMLFDLFKKIRADRYCLEELLKNGGRKASLLFIEGFFDAEGCVKIIKEPVRKTPKICLDFTNTDYPLLELIRKLLSEHLCIEARYSIQEPKAHWKGKNKLTAYHLRIYKKEFVRRFFENIRTTKLKLEKVQFLDAWLNLNASSRAGSFSLPVPS